MPVTIRPSPEKVGRNTDKPSAVTRDYCHVNVQAQHGAVAAFLFSQKHILHSSFPAESPTNIIPYPNGFVDGVIRAFQQDLHLVLRPDDVWLAITTQFSHYVNGHAEELRGKFVAHEGQKHLDAGGVGSTFRNLDVAKMSRKLTCLVEEHLVDKEIRNWLIPDFSTTTDNDVAVASMTMLSTFKQFFSYAARTGCGFPSVTLEGTNSDWANMRMRLNLLLSGSYGTELEEWAKLLVPVLDRFVRTFDEPESQELKDFYLSVVHTSPQMSGRTTTYDGWITAFTYFRANGSRNRPQRSNPAVKPYTLDGLSYPSIEWNSITVGVVEVPVTIEAHEQSTTYETLIIAGSVGLEILEDGEAGSKVAPKSGWWMREVSRKPMRVTGCENKSEDEGNMEAEA